MSSHTIIPGKDVRFAERTRTHDTDATPAPAGPAPEAAPHKIEFKRFPNGMVLGWQENPHKPGSFVIHDASGTPYLIALHAPVADMVCQAVTFLFHERDKAIARQAQELAKLNEAAAINSLGTSPKAEEYPTSKEIAEKILETSSPAPAPFVALPSPAIQKGQDEQV